MIRLLPPYLPICYISKWCWLYVLKIWAYRTTELESPLLRSRSSPVLPVDFTVCLSVISVVTDNHLCVFRDGSQEKSAPGLEKWIIQFQGYTSDSELLFAGNDWYGYIFIRCQNMWTREEGYQAHAAVWHGGSRTGSLLSRCTEGRTETLRPVPAQLLPAVAVDGEKEGLCLCTGARSCLKFMPRQKEVFTDYSVLLRLEENLRLDWGENCEITKRHLFICEHRLPRARQS